MHLSTSGSFEGAYTVKASKRLANDDGIQFEVEDLGAEAGAGAGLVAGEPLDLAHRLGPVLDVVALEPGRPADDYCLWIGDKMMSFWVQGDHSGR